MNSRSRGPIPERVHRFILTSVPSIPFLEAMLLLRSDPDVPWDARAVSKRLYMSEDSASAILAGLASAGIATATASSAADAQFLYQPAGPELADVLDEVAMYYTADLVGVTTLVHARVDKRALQFADAFRWKKET